MIIFLTSIKCTKELVEAGADVCIKNEEEQTPIHKAALYGRSAIIEILIHGKGHMDNKDLIYDEDENSGSRLVHFKGPRTRVSRPKKS